MIVVSTNIGERKELIWEGKSVETGIFKYAVGEGVFLKKEDVDFDNVVDRKYHGGIDKACYAFGSDSYPEWEKLYPNLKFEYGMFGENLTIKGLDEKIIQIGSQYKVGEAVIEVSQPRTPCFKLGIRFENQSVLKHFVNLPYSGIYFRVIKEGKVKTGDELELINSIETEPTVYEVHSTKFGKPSASKKQKVTNSKYLSISYFN